MILVIFNLRVFQFFSLFIPSSRIKFCIFVFQSIQTKVCNCHCAWPTTKSPKLLWCRAALVRPRSSRRRTSRRCNRETTTKHETAAPPQLRLEAAVEESSALCSRETNLWVYTNIIFLLTNVEFNLFEFSFGVFGDYRLIRNLRLWVCQSNSEHCFDRSANKLFLLVRSKYQ